MSAKNKNQLGTKAREIWYSLVFTDINRLDDSIRGLANSMSNARKPDSGIDRDHVVKLIDFMNKNKLTTVSELVQFLAKKWQGIYNTEQDAKKNNSYTDF
jgi:hypothetical protein